ncbi:hypothetical protein F0562_031046 [Nyssa sinensis]|uniref:Uncharacterized protein n=1 Tax=Nyssa sinensis TaxID=561372 RepID=A0A5J5ASF7_9ASTE|nr:hypothetical protein F0562_031046 [Nyssa sinensis]
MGLGSLGNGGSSSSSSNLSASAPPFSVDRSNPKPPLFHLTESFSSSFHNWQYSHSSASTPDFFGNPVTEVDSIRTTYLPSMNDHLYSGSQSISSPSTHWPPLNPTVKNETNAFSYLQYSGGIPTNHVDSKPYYPSYVPPVDDDTPLVSLNEPSYDLLSSSLVVPLDGSSQVDYTESLSGLEYTTQWGGFWNGLADREQGKRLELDRSFCSEEMDVAGSYAYKDYMKQGACIAQSLRKCEQEAAIPQRKSVNVLGRENCDVSLSTGQLDGKPFLVQNPTFIPVESSRTSLLGSTSILPESHLQGPSLESAMNSLNSQKPPNPSYEKCFQPDKISVTKHFPALVIRPPPIGTTSTAPKAVPSETVNYIHNNAAVNSKEFDGHNSTKIKVLDLPQSSEFKERLWDTSQLCFHLGTNDPIFVASFSDKKEELTSNLVGKDAVAHTFKSRSGFEFPDINVPDGFALAVDGAKTVSSVENPTESLDHHNPAVDSPCWKGAPTSHFSPFEVSKVGTPQDLMNTFEASNSLNIQGTQILPLDTDDTVKISFQKPCEDSVHHENECGGNGSSVSPNRSLSANCAAKQHRSDAVNAGLDCPNLSTCNGVQFSTDVDYPRKEYNLPNDSKPSPTKQLNLEEGDFTSKIMFKLEAGVADIEMDTIDASEDGCVPFNAMEYVSCFPSGEDGSKPTKLHGRVSTPKINVQMLVNAMHNLSELLLFHCSNDATVLNEQDRVALEHAINNLNVCISQKTAHMTPTLKSVLPQQGISLKFGELPDFHEGDGAGRPKVTRAVAANSHDQLDCQHMHEEKRNSNAHSKKVHKFPDFVSLRDDADVVRDDCMVQAIKKVLNENFHSEEEIQPQALLYKNLWLEAEAAVCSINYRARFDRLKIEMERCKLHGAKEFSEDARAVEKLPISGVCPDPLPISGVSPDPDITHKLTTEAKDSPIQYTSIQDSPISSTTSLVDDVEASTMARFHILKCRGDNSNSKNMERQQLPEVDDAAFAVKRKCWPFVGYQSEGGILDVELEPLMQHHGGNHSGENFGFYIDGSDYETVKDFRACVTDDPVTQSCRNNRLENQLPSGCYDSSSSDWEHVLKDEFPLQN